MLWTILRPATAIFVLAMAASAALAQEAPVYAVTYIETTSSGAKQAGKLIAHRAEASRAATGNVRSVALHRIDRPNQFALLAAFKDQKSADDDAQSAAAKEFADKLQPLLIAPVDTRSNGGLDVAAPTTRAAGTEAVYGVTHVDVVPNRKDDGIAALKAAVAPSRAESGNRAYDVWQQSSRPNHFTLVEIWRDRKALESHEEAGPTRKLRETLLPIGGALFDQRLYHALD
jgi:quinol monooxygenase YgiN